MMTNMTLTAGATAFIGTMAKPAARTATDWNRPAAILVPTGMASMALGSGGLDSTHGVPMSKIIKLTKSIVVRMITTQTRNQVVVEGKR